MMPMRPSAVLLSCAIAGLAASAALAQAANYMSVEAIGRQAPATELPRLGAQE